MAKPCSKLEPLTKEGSIDEKNVRECMRIANETGALGTATSCKWVYLFP